MRRFVDGRIIMPEQLSSNLVVSQGSADEGSSPFESNSVLEGIDGRCV
jgi:hypothetical protein